MKFSLRINEEEKLKLKMEAEKNNCSMNEYIRNIINGDLETISKKIYYTKQLTDEYKELSYQIRSIGNVLNQANRNFFQEENVDIEAIQKKLEELWQLIKS